ncbi:hypothetical protein AB0E64_05345 [Streptomyces caelestis]|uniref:Uncharacterized protein n=1 Tax=Streptomyces caelestis TaxID=36816 RepID=A0A7W9H879_9ACTN|nr:hypothetical protein [Streptomyces caelestis]MBB5797512.1 hypothetical protein [Streptomyces caelestis]GGW38654.1 hypothetical protein GCM10010320_18050 [Streptomyces caelestis]
MLAQRSLVPRRQSIQVRQKKAGGVPSFIQVASLACVHHLGDVAAEDVKGVALHQDSGEPSAGHANHGVVATVCEQLGLNALHRAIQADITG